MRLILVRHGQTTSNTGFLLDTAVPGANLTELGRRQAEDLVARLDEYPIAAIYASVLVRTQQTAAPLAAKLGLPVTILEGLREISAGDDEMSADATNYINTMLAWRDGDLSARVPGGESAVEFMMRYEGAICQVAAAGHDVAVCFSHGAATRTWSWARIRGFKEALGDGVLQNTGFVVADGDPVSGWDLVRLEGLNQRSGYLVDGQRV
ncbi:MAG: histidine phosphatase family protein [Propionibacteriaceae bacterium]|jgi:probable phosphoglycerate mutase|nr:histidine phosphatase family protein [Propionibacteriaceae bacterium]